MKLLLDASAGAGGDGEEEETPLEFCQGKYRPT